MGEARRKTMRACVTTVVEWCPQFGPLLPSHYRCAMCGKIFGKGWSDEEARAEAAANSIDVDHADLVCGCYRLTPWGRS